MSMNDFINMLSKEQKLALLNALQENSPSVSSVSDDTKKETIKHINDTASTEKNNVSDDFRVSSIKNNNNKRREPVRARKNEWVDDGEDRHIETKYGSRTPRSREPHKKVDVECSVCGRSFKTDPKYVYGEYHRCNKCIGR